MLGSHCQQDCQVPDTGRTQRLTRQGSAFSKQHGWVVVGGEEGDGYGTGEVQKLARQGPPPTLGSPETPDSEPPPRSPLGGGKLEAHSPKVPTQAATLTLLVGFSLNPPLGRMSRAGWGVGGSVSIYRMYSHL